MIRLPPADRKALPLRGSPSFLFLLHRRQFVSLLTMSVSTYSTKLAFHQQRRASEFLIGSSGTRQSVQTLIDVGGNLLDCLFVFVLFFFISRSPTKKKSRARFTKMQLLLKGQKKNRKLTETRYNESRNVLLCVRNNSALSCHDCLCSFSKQDNKLSSDWPPLSY